MHATLFEKAVAFATLAHDGQRRKYTDEPYIIHPLRVAQAVPSNVEGAKVVAVLHDVLEDTRARLVWPKGQAPYLLYEYVHWNSPKPTKFLRLTLDAELARALQALTRVGDESYGDYMRRVITTGGKIARVVKMADLTDNIATLPTDSPLHARYKHAVMLLLAPPPRTPAIDRVVIADDFMGSAETCPDCEGSGTVGADRDVGDCPTCDGEGVVSA